MLLIVLDFITRLSPSRGNSVILSIVNYFFKSVHGLPLSKEIVDFVFTQIFLILGILLEVVSYWDHSSSTRV